MLLSVVNYIFWSPNNRDLEIAICGSYLKSDKLVHSNLEHEKLFPSYLEVEKFCFRYFAAIWREKSESLLFEDHKILLTTVWSKEKDYDSYLKSEKLFHSNLERNKNVSELFRS